MRLLVAIFALMLSANMSLAKEREHRVALVIGNSKYTTIPELRNPGSDARLIAAQLRRIGFETQEYVDADSKSMRRAVKLFSDTLSRKGRNTIGFVFYAGHGMQVRENNYLLPIDVEIKKESDLGLEVLHLADVLNALFEAENKLNIVVLDACRDNPLRRTLRTAGFGLAGFDAPVGTIVSYSTGPGKVAYDGAGDNSPFSAQLATAIADPALKIEDAFKRTSERVFEITQRRQLPWYTSAVHGEFFLAQSLPLSSAPPDRTVVGQAGTSRSPGDSGGVAPGIQDRVAFYIDWKFFASDNGAKRLGPDAYEPLLRAYYGKRMVPREQVLLDKDKYYARWPNRRFSLLRDTLRVSEVEPGLYDVAFEFRFDVESDTRQSQGRSRMSLGLRRIGSDFVIAWQDEKISERTLIDKSQQN